VGTINLNEAGDTPVFEEPFNARKGKLRVELI